MEWGDQGDFLVFRKLRAGRNNFVSKFRERGLVSVVRP